MRQTNPAAALGVCAAVTAYVIERHYLQVEWSIAAPVPMVWWAVGGILGVLGAPLLCTALGRRAEPLLDRPWQRLLLTWVLPCLVAHVVWLGLIITVLGRLDPGFTGIPVRDTAEILSVVVFPPPEFSLLWVLALFPVVAKLTQRWPAAAVIVLLCALTMLTTAPTFVIFMIVGLRLQSAIDHLGETATWPNIALRAAVALVLGGAVLGVDRFPDGLDTAVAGLAVLPFALTVVSWLSRLRLDLIGEAAVAIFLVLIPVAAVFDKILLARIGLSGSAIQYLAALVEPLIIVAAVVAAGVLIIALTRRVLRRGKAPVLIEVDR
ncbi:MAG: hypothetical protein QOE51_4819 [Actinoplanes sp.]|jgi:hypothetical protein|nr:hypothetical protein [Actinoplanes sp.]